MDLVAGLDEAGRGALAGPVVAAVVILGPSVRLPGVDDSKRLRPTAREALVPAILAAAADIGLGLATAEEVDRLNVLQATLRAAARALGDLRRPPSFLLTDHLRLAGGAAEVMALPGADGASLAVAAASILAKVTRDRLMIALEAEYPEYGFLRHKGYGTADHLAALARHGPSAAHRSSFAGVRWFGERPVLRCLSGRRGALPLRPPPALPLRELLRSGLPPGAILGWLPEAEFASGWCGRGA